MHFSSHKHMFNEINLSWMEFTELLSRLSVAVSLINV